MDFINQAKQLTDTVRDKFQAGANNAADNIEGAIAQVNTAVAEITDRGVATVNEFTTAAVQPGMSVLQNAGKSLSNMTAAAVGFTTSSLALADALKDLPRTAEELTREMPKIANRLRHRYNEVKTHIHIALTPTAKKLLQQRASERGCRSISDLVEKWAREEIT